MWDACAPFRAGFITPMAAVAGAVAQELIACYHRPGIERAWINNGGDIALHLAPGQSARVGLFADLARFDLARRRAAHAPTASSSSRPSMPVRGVATSGWRGRSFSLGIADSVTVLAATAAQADAAATVIANAVDVDDAAHPPPAGQRMQGRQRPRRHPGDGRRPPLAPATVRRALDAGVGTRRGPAAPRDCVGRDAGLPGAMAARRALKLRACGSAPQSGQHRADAVGSVFA